MDILIKHGDAVRCIKAWRISWVGHIVGMDKGRTVKRITGWRLNAVRSIG